MSIRPAAIQNQPKLDIFTLSVKYVQCWNSIQTVAGIGDTQYLHQTLSSFLRACKRCHTAFYHGHWTLVSMVLPSKCAHKSRMTPSSTTSCVLLFVTLKEGCSGISVSNFSSIWQCFALSVLVLQDYASVQNINSGVSPIHPPCLVHFCKLYAVHV